MPATWPQWNRKKFHGVKIMECWPPARRAYGSERTMAWWSKTHNFCVWIKGFGINFQCFCMNVLIGSRDNHCLMAIMALPNEWLIFLLFLKWFNQLKQLIFNFIGQDVKGDCILPNSKLFKPPINVFSIHDLLISWIMMFFNGNEVQYKPNIPSFHCSLRAVGSTSRRPLFQLWAKRTRFQPLSLLSIGGTMDKPKYIKKVELDI